MLNARGASAARPLQPEDSYVRAPVLYGHSGYAWLEVETPRACRARIHDEMFAASFDQWLVRVPEHNYICFVARDQLLRSGAAEFVPMTDVKGQSCQIQHNSGIETRLSNRVRVAKDGMDRRDRGKRVENRPAANVARMENHLNARKRVEDLGPHKTVRIRDETDHTADHLFSPVRERDRSRLSANRKYGTANVARTAAAANAVAKP